MNSNEPNTGKIGKCLKIGAAMVGAGFFVGMAGLTVAFGGNEAYATGPTPPPTEPPSATLGATVTGGAAATVVGGAGATTIQSTAPSTLATVMASPTVFATPFVGQQGNPNHH